MPGSINHPDPTKNENLTTLNFAAFGRASPDIVFVRAYLVGEDGRRFRGHTIQHPHHFQKGFWIAQFLLGEEGYAPNSTFSLELWDDTSPSQGQLALMPDILYVDQFAGLIVTYPAGGDTVCPQFAAYGTSDQSAAVSATMTGNNITGFSAVQTTGPPNWVLSCSVSGRASAQNPGTFTATQAGEQPFAVQNLGIGACQ